MEVGVEQALENVLCDLLRRDAVVVPGLDDAINRVGDNSLGNLTRGLVQQQRKVVLRQERVSRVGSIPVIPYLLLVVRIDDRLRRRAQRVGSGTYEGLDERLQGGDDKHGDRVCDLLDQS